MKRSAAFEAHRLHAGTWLLVLALALVLATFAQPRISVQQLQFRHLAIFDITQSMNVRDVGTHDDGAPTRLDFAKRTLRDALDLIPCGNELGVGIFTQHRSVLLMAPVEVCANYSELLALIDKISWRMAWDARSEVAKGLYSSVEVAKAIGDEARVVFFTDGHEAPPVNPDYKPRFDGTPGHIKGLVVGVGGDVPVPIPKLDLDGQQLGNWRADEVLQVDTYSLGRGAASGEQLVGVNPGDVAERIAAGTEHLSQLRERYLLETATAIGLGYHRLRGARALAAELMHPRLGVPRPAQLELRRYLVAFALLLLAGYYLVNIRASPGIKRSRRSRAA